MNRIKTLQELNLLDRFLFSEVMADNEILEDVLEIILGHPVPLKDKAQAEKELRRTPQNKSVYFDVYGEDIRDVAYDLEVQQKNTKDLPKRTRYSIVFRLCPLFKAKTLQSSNSGLVLWRTKNWLFPTLTKPCAN